MAGVIRDQQGRILVAQRPPGSHLAGLWEFPGGKREPGESPFEALVRELDEELGIRVTAAHPLIGVPFAYPGKRIHLDVWQVTSYGGEPWSREGQLIRWVDESALGDYPMPAADHPVIAALRLPSQYLITPDWSPEHAAALRDGVLRSLRKGLCLIRMRLPQWSLAQQRKLLADLHPELHAHAAVVLGSGDANAVVDAGFDGLHLSARAAAALDRRPIGRDRWLAVSCHDAHELQHAARIDADFATLSPVLATPSHPDANVLGWTAFAELVRAAAMPVYALGGMGATWQTAARDNGAQGIAAIRGLWPTTADLAD